MFSCVVHLFLHRLSVYVWLEGNRYIYCTKSSEENKCNICKLSLLLRIVIIIIIIILPFGIHIRTFTTGWGWMADSLSVWRIFWIERTIDEKDTSWKALNVFVESFFRKSYQQMFSSEKSAATKNIPIQIFRRYEYPDSLEYSIQIKAQEYSPLVLNIPWTTIDVPQTRINVPWMFHLFAGS